MYETSLVTQFYNCLLTTVKRNNDSFFLLKPSASLYKIVACRLSYSSVTVTQPIRRQFS